MDFNPTWCPLCKLLHAELENLAPSCRGRVDTGKLNAILNRGLARRHRINNEPTVIVFRHGEKDRPGFEMIQTQ